MTNVAEVYLWGTRIGIVALQNDNRTSRFEYDKDFIKSGIEVSPIMMSLSERVYSFPELSEQSFRGLPGLLADSLPDKFGNIILDVWLASQGRDRESLNVIEQLCYTGKRGMGALEFVPALSDYPTEYERIQVNQLAGLASDILSQRYKTSYRNDSHLMEQIIKVGTSAGGARAKAIVAWNEKTGDIRSGQINPGDGYEYWLIKFGNVEGNRDKEEVDRPEYTKIEYAYYLMALAAGIKMNECRLFSEGGVCHFMTKRFDRIGDKGDKLHMQTLGALAHYDYNIPGAYSYEQAAKVIRLLGMGQKEIEELYKRMVFNVMARNQDDHVKNISFLMDKDGIWSLAPAYDITYAYNPGGIWTGSHQMTINGKRDSINMDDLIQCSNTMNISHSRANNTISCVSQAVSNWQEFAYQAGLNEDVAIKIGKTHEHTTVHRGSLPK